MSNAISTSSETVLSQPPSAFGFAIDAGLAAAAEFFATPSGMAMEEHFAVRIRKFLLSTEVPEEVGIYNHVSAISWQCACDAFRSGYFIGIEQQLAPIRAITRALKARPER